MKGGLGIRFHEIPGIDISTGMTTLILSENLIFPKDQIIQKKGSDDDALVWRSSHGQ